MFHLHPPVVLGVVGCVWAKLCLVPPVKFGQVPTGCLVLQVFSLLSPF